MADQPNTTENSASAWGASQVYVMAAVCFALGILIGYLLHSPATSAAALSAVPGPQMQAPANMPPGMPKQMPTPEQMKQMADKTASPLLQQLQSEPKNAELLMQIAYVYKSAHQFKEAASYFDRSLQIDPKNVTARTEMASCLYYTGDVDKAIAQLQQSLKYDPKHAGTLFNLGMMRWKGKSDAEGAIAAWEKLLSLYPNYERKAAVQQLIAEAKQHGRTVVANAPKARADSQ
jgi:cytochrome c-type biogenesis protein CcmH/NrfG